MVHSIFLLFYPWLVHQIVHEPLFSVFLLAHTTFCPLTIITQCRLLHLWPNAPVFSLYSYMAAGFTLLLVNTLNFRENLNEVGTYSAQASRNFDMYIKYIIGFTAHFTKPIQRRIVFRTQAYDPMTLLIIRFIPYGVQHRVNTINNINIVLNDLVLKCISIWEFFFLWIMGNPSFPLLMVTLTCESNSGQFRIRSASLRTLSMIQT